MCVLLLFRGREDVGLLHALPADLATLQRDFDILPLANMRIESRAFPDASVPREICIFALYNYILVSS